MDVQTAAKILGVSEERVRKLCQAGRLGEKIAGVWIIREDELREYLKIRRGPGRPPSTDKADD